MQLSEINDPVFHEAHALVFGFVVAAAFGLMLIFGYLFVKFARNNPYDDWPELREHVAERERRAKGEK